MTRRKQSFLYILVAFFMALSVSAKAAETNILLFDPQRAVAQSLVGKNVQEQGQKLSSETQAKANQYRQELQSEAQKIEEQRSLLAQDALRGKMEELQRKQTERTQELNERGRTIEAAINKAFSEISSVIDEELKKLAKERNADFILNRNVAFVTDPAADITDEIVSRLDKRIKEIALDIK